MSRPSLHYEVRRYLSQFCERFQERAVVVPEHYYEFYDPVEEIGELGNCCICGLKTPFWRPLQGFSAYNGPSLYVPGRFNYREVCSETCQWEWEAAVEAAEWEEAAATEEATGEAKD